MAAMLFLVTFTVIASVGRLKRSTAMTHLKNVQKFTFDLAQYRVDDGNGGTLLLRVDYKNNNYSIEGSPRHKALRRDAAEIARNLLKRKHGVNFAERVNQGIARN